ncbi:DUF485 domain-containing protein [Amycolatopsis sp.]|jgi:uncharacterized membrane protein (DUF485 family)|uniref:DUF485 domain-containing protein n=1 Tax=Amycolatopsis sp. TaxID=37632 RepID=UPI002E0B1FD0|nr:DUF485 domain-containing protein [Amycolatopsis sp.]
MQYAERSHAARNALEETGRIPVLFARPGEHPVLRAPSGPDYDRIQHSPEFLVLRRRLRRFVFPVSLLFFAWYMTYVLLAAYAHDFMSRKVVGQINVAIVFGLLQFVTTIIITTVYLRFARRRIDPQVAYVRRLAGVEDQ